MAGRKWRRRWRSDVTELTRGFGREAFGADPSGYVDARPGYPEPIWDVLRVRCGVERARVLEIGPGPGIATGPLLEAGSSVVAVEPDQRLAAFLATRFASPRLTVINGPFETAPIPHTDFDVACAFTAFHWLDAEPALARIRALLRPDGWWAPCWNVFGDSDRPDPFHEATQTLMRPAAALLLGGARSATPDPHDVGERIAEFRAAGFDNVEVERIAWTLQLDTQGVRALYGTFSNITALGLAERARVLDGLADIAEREFAGCVTRNMVTVLYTARRT